MALTKKEQYDEIIKCGQDPIYFIKKYLYISHPTKGRLPFELFPFQEECIESFISYRSNIVLKSRQLGLSTTTAAYCLWMAMFKRDVNILVMATKLEVGKFMVQKIRTAFKMLPSWMLGMLNLTDPEAESVKYLKFSNGSKITAIPTSGDAGRGEAVTLLVVDEAAHIDNLEELWLGLRPTLSTGGRVIMFSSPAGKNFFYRMWMDAETGEWEEGKVGQHCKGIGKNGFHGIKLPWNVHPERDDKWFEEEIKAMDARGVAQELMCVDPYTRIETIDGFKYAQDMCVGDLVLTHKGNYKPVISVGSRPVEEHENLYSVSVPLNREEPLLITGNHPVYGKKFSCTSAKNPLEVARDVQSDFYSLDDISAYQKKYSDRFLGVLHPALYAAKFFLGDSLNELDLFELPVKRKVLKGEHLVGYWRQRSAPTLRHWKIDYDFGRFIGLSVAEGCLTRDVSKNGAVVEGLQLAFHHDEYETLGRFVVGFLEAKGVQATTNIRTYSRCFTVETSNKYVVELYKLFVKPGDATTKTVNMELFRRTNPEFVKGFLVGHFDGDGDHLKAAKANNLGKKLKVVSKSRKLLYQVRTLLAMFGHYGRINHSTGYYELDGVDQLTEPTMEAVLGVTKTQLEKTGSRAKLLGNEVVGSIQYEVIPSTACPVVWNIEVADDNSYVANGLIVHNCAFEGSSLTFFPQASIDYVRNMSQRPMGHSGPNGRGNDLHIWKTPVEGHKYVLAADVARGDSEDFSAFHVFDVLESEVVAEYMGKIPPDKFGEFLIEVGTKYNNALIVNEKNTVGLATAIKLRDNKYPTLYYEPDLQEKMLMMTPEEKAEVLPGFTITQKNREKILENLEMVIRNHHLKIYSLRFVEQMETFIWTGKRGQALKKRHDDLILAMAVGLTTFTPMAHTNTYVDVQAGANAAAQAFLSGISRGYKDVKHTVDGKKVPAGVDPHAVRAAHEFRKEFWWMYDGMVPTKG